LELIRWSSASWIPGLFCTKFEAPADPDGWSDNFLCSTRDLKLRWSYSGPIEGMVCTHIFEGSDPDGWSNNYLCSPHDYGFRWSFEKPIAGMQCLQVNEPKDQHTWHDNFLCWPRTGVLKAIPAPPVNRAGLLNLIRAKYDYQAYLAIGQGKKEDGFDAVDTRIKIGVDPDRQLNAAFQMTADEFFAQNKLVFDLISIGGLHDAGQVDKAVANALKVLRPGGTILVYDCNPKSEDQQRVPGSNAESWTGDVWKAWVKLRATREDLEMFVVNLETGLGVITRGKQKKVTLPAPLGYETLAAKRKDLLNLVEVDELVKELTGK
jgi:SAM-dependent methyltransferase